MHGWLAGRRRDLADVDQLHLHGIGQSGAKAAIGPRQRHGGEAHRQPCGAATAAGLGRQIEIGLPGLRQGVECCKQLPAILKAAILSRPDQKIRALRP
jgi:hypothetical protein